MKAAAPAAAAAPPFENFREYYRAHVLPGSGPALKFRASLQSLFPSSKPAVVAQT